MIHTIYQVKQLLSQAITKQDAETIKRVALWTSSRPAQIISTLMPASLRHTKEWDL